MKDLVLFLSIIFSYSVFGQLFDCQSRINVAAGSVYGNIGPRGSVVGFDPTAIVSGQTGKADDLNIAGWNDSDFDTTVTEIRTGKVKCELENRTFTDKIIISNN